MLAPQPNIDLRSYFGAVATATIAYAAARRLTLLLWDSLHPFRADHFAVVLICLLILAVVICAAALVPCIFVVQIAKRHNIRNPYYYALWGAVVGMLLGPPVLAMLPGFVTDGEDVPPWLYADRLILELVKAGPALALSGAVGGVTYWLISRQRATVQA